MRLSSCTQHSFDVRHFLANSHRRIPRFLQQHKTFCTRARSVLSKYTSEPLFIHCDCDLRQHSRNLHHHASNESLPTNRFLPRYISNSTDLKQLFIYLDENASLLGTNRVFKVLRKAMYNACSNDREKLWNVYTEINKHSMTSLLEEKDYMYILNILKYGDAKSLSNLLVVLQDMRVPKENQMIITPKAYSQVLFAMARHGQAKQACQLLKEMRDDNFIPDANHYLSLALAAKKEGDPATMQKVATFVLDAATNEDIALKPETHSIIVSGLSRTNNVQAAINFLRKTESLPVENNTKATSEYDGNKWLPYNVHTYTSLLSGLAGSGAANQGRDLFEEMKKQGVKPNVVTYSALIEAYGKAGRLDEAVQFLKLYTYKAKNSSLNRVMATSLLVNCLRHNRLDIAESLLSYWTDKMKVDPKKMDDKFRAAMVWVSVKGSVEGGRAFFDKLYNEDKKYVNEVMVNHLVIASGNKGNIDAVRGSYAMHEKIQEDGAAPSSRAQHHVVDALFKCRDVPAALLAFVSMRKHGIPDDITLAMVIRGLVLNDEDEVAWRLFKTLKSGGVEPNLHAYTSMLKIIAKRQVYADSKLIPSELLRAFDISSSKRQHGADLKQVQAYQLFKSMTGYHKPNEYTYTTLISCFAKHNIGRAMDIFITMCADDVQPTVVTYTVLLQGCAIFRNAQQALMVFKHMQDRNVTPNKHAWHYLLKALRRSRMDKSDIDEIGAMARAATKC